MNGDRPLKVDKGSKPPTCLYHCSNPATMTREIGDLSRDMYGKAYYRKRRLAFCSPKCAAKYQMGCEG